MTQLELEQRHKGIKFPEDATLFIGGCAPPPPLSQIRELKICESCGKTFARTVTEELDAQGLIRRIGHPVCDFCFARNQEGQVMDMRQQKALIEIAQDFKDRVQMFRRSGASHVFVKTEGIKRTRRIKWRDPLMQAFQKRKEMTRSEIAEITGSNYKTLIYYLQSAGFPLIRVGTKRSSNNRSVAVYALS